MESPRNPNGQVAYLIPKKLTRDHHLAPLDQDAHKRLVVALGRVGPQILADRCRVGKTSLYVAQRGEALGVATRDKINVGVRDVLHETAPPPVAKRVVAVEPPEPHWTTLPQEGPFPPLPRPEPPQTLPLAVEVPTRTLLPPVATLARRAHSLAQALDDAEQLFDLLAEADDKERDPEGMSPESLAWLKDHRTQRLIGAYRRSGLRNRAE